MTSTQHGVRPRRSHHVRRSEQGTGAARLLVHRQARVRRAHGRSREDATWELPNRKDRFEYGGPNDKEGTYKLLTGFLTPFDEFSFSVKSLTAEGDRVAVEANSHGVGPGSAEYINNYQMMWTIKDGKVLSVKEALDPFQVLAYVEQVQAQ